MIIDEAWQSVARRNDELRERSNHLPTHAVRAPRRARSRSGPTPAVPNPAPLEQLRGPPIITSVTAPRHHDGTVSFDLGDESVLFQPDTNAVYALNADLTAAWRSLTGAKPTTPLPAEAISLLIGAGLVDRGSSRISGLSTSRSVKPPPGQQIPCAVLGQASDSHGLERAPRWHERSTPTRNGPPRAVHATRHLPLGDVVVRVTAGDRTTSRLIDALAWPEGPLPTTAPVDLEVDRVAGEYRICHDHRVLARSMHFSEALCRLESAVESAHETLSESFVFVHAAVVEWNNRAVVLPGASTTGKTVLTAELVRRGARYVSDNWCVITSNGAVVPIPRTLHRRDRSGRLRSLDPQLIGRTARASELHAGLIVKTGFRHGLAAELDDGSARESVLSMVPHCRTVGRGRDAVAALARLATNARFLHGPRGEARTTATQILGALPAAVDP